MKVEAIVAAGIVLVLSVTFAGAAKATKTMTKPGKRYLVTQRVVNQDGTGFTAEFVKSMVETMQGQEIDVQPVVNESPNSLLVTYRFTAVRPVDVTPGAKLLVGPYSLTVVQADLLS